MKDAKRGFVPSDEREFGDKTIPNLRQAADEVLFLLNHGYPVKGATRFVGDHYMFSERQRLALARIVSPEEQIASRLSMTYVYRGHGVHHKRRMRRYR